MKAVILHKQYGVGRIVNDAELHTINVHDSSYSTARRFHSVAAPFSVAASLLSKTVADDAHNDVLQG
jgi:hypothetical protein